jgi:hypothetical protein
VAGINAEQQEVVVLNRSDEPVYQAVASLILIQGAGPQTGEDLTKLIEQTSQMASYRAAMGLIPPGRWRTFVDGGWGGMGRRPGIEVAFTDSAGVHWVRRTNGKLDEISENPFRRAPSRGLLSLIAETMRARERSAFVVSTITATSLRQRRRRPTRSCCGPL